MKQSLFILALLISAACTAKVPAKKELTPKSSTTTNTLVGKKAYTYYVLSNKKSTEYVVRGPGKITLNIRGRIEDNSFENLPQTIRCERSGKSMVSYDIPALKPSNLKFKSSKIKGSPTKLHKITIDVPPGKHTYKFKKYNTKGKSLLRVFYQKYPKPQWVDVTPIPPLKHKEIKYIKSGTVRRYKHITKDESFNFAVSDSGYYRIIVRPEFSYRMLEEATIKILIRNKTTGQSKSYKLNARRSSKLEYVSDKKHIPGTESTFYVQLGSTVNATDDYEVSIVSGAKSAIIRISSDKKLAI